MQSRGNRAIRLWLIVAVSSDLVGCAVYTGALMAADDGGSTGGAFASGGVSGSVSGSGGMSSAQGGDAASSGDGALASSGFDSGSSGSAEAFGQGGSGGSSIGSGALGGSGEMSAGLSSGAAGAGVGSNGGVGIGGNGGSGGRGGNAGASGNSGAADCNEHPLTAKSKWVVTASSAAASSPLVNVDDGNLVTRWSTGVSQKSDWLQVDFGADVSLDSITLAIGDSSNDYPRAYEVRLSELSQNSSATALASGKGQEAMDTVIDLAEPAVGRYLLISQTGSINGIWWSIAELKFACLH
jgi:hypothetical protein